jgi:hypothetical protein
VKVRNISGRSIVNYGIAIKPGEVKDVPKIDPVVSDRIIKIQSEEKKTAAKTVKFGGED